MILRKSLRWLFLLLSIFVICFAVLLTTLRFMTPLINHYRENIEVWAGEVLHSPVHIGKVVASWQGLSPIIQLQNVALLDTSSQQTVLSIQELDISIALYSSLRERRINPGYLSITGARLSVNQTQAGAWIVAGLGSAQTQQTGFNSVGILQWLSAQNQISLKNISIKFQDKKGVKIPLSDVTLILHNDNKNHHLVGKGKIDQKQPAHFYFIVDMKGKPSELKKNTIHSYLWVSHLNLQYWLQNFPIKNKAITAGLISGQLWLNRQQGQWQALTSTVTLQNMKLQDLSTAAQISFNNLDGELFWQSNSDPILLLKSQNFNFYDSSLFTHPIVLGQMQAILQTQACGALRCIALKQLSLQCPALDANIRALFSLPQPHFPSQINLLGSYQINDVRQIPHYLPEKIMGKGFTKWLQAAPLAGQGVNGKLSVQGSLADFPYSKGEGQFFNQIDFTHLGLDYFQGWPAAYNITGRLIFKNDSLFAHITAGTIINAPLTQVNLNIPVLSKTEPVILTIEGQAVPDLNDILIYIQNSPLRLDEGLLQTKIHAQGPTALQLHLVFPLDNAPQTDMQVQGRVDMSRGQITEIKRNLSIENLQGQVQFTQAAITAPQLTGELLGYPLQLAVQTQMNAQKIPQVIISGSGGINVADFLKKNFPVLAPLTQGATVYNFNFSAPLSEQSTLLPTFSLTSDLKGLALNLPTPLNKATAMLAPTTINIDFNKTQPPSLRFNYDNTLTGALQFTDKNQQTELAGGELRFGPDLAVYQDSPGLLIDGTMDSLDVSAWQTLFKQLQPPATPPKTDPHLIRLLDLRINELLIFKQLINNIEVQATHPGSIWAINVFSTEAEGSIKVNDDYPQSSLVLNFKHLILPAADPADKTPSQLTPAGWPPLYFDCQQCQYGATDLGIVSLNLKPIPEGVDIEKLSIQAPNVAANAMGSWVLKNGMQQTQLQGKVHSNNFGSLLKSLKLTSNIEGKTGEAVFNLNWHSPPTDPTLTQVQGTVQLKLGEGKIVDVGSHQGDIDIGKLLNIFSVKSLLRHLQFGFTDLTENGYDFTVMKGDYVLQQGMLSTQNTYFDGPIAKLTIKGDMNLKQQQYKVLLGVTPYLTTSIPMLVTVAGTAVAGPFGIVAGAATWAVSKMLSPEIEKMTTYQYQVTGPFKDPKITEAKTPNQRQVPYQ